MPSKIAKAARSQLSDMTTSEIRLMMPETTKVTKKTVTTQRIVRERSFLEASEWVFATKNSPFENSDKMTAADRINLTA